MAEAMSEQTIASPGFAALKLPAALLAALDKVGYETPSPIQAEAIPPLLAGRDLLGHAPTGTGKTAAFALPLLARIDLRQKDPQVLTLTPTRELAIQVAEAFQRYAAGIPGACRSLLQRRLIGALEGSGVLVVAACLQPLRRFVRQIAPEVTGRDHRPAPVPFPVGFGLRQLAAFVRCYLTRRCGAQPERDGAHHHREPRSPMLLASSSAGATRSAICASVMRIWRKLRRS